MKINLNGMFDKRRCLRAFALPRSVSPGRVLVHNHVQHTVDMPNGMNGFRGWTQKGTKGLVVCKCGWSGLPHYRVRGMGGRCEPGNWIEHCERVRQAYQAGA